jgi:dUTP pyrophosphatase
MKSCGIRLTHSYTSRERRITMRIKLDEGAKMPTRAHPTDAGMDLYARETQIVPAREYAIFDTGVHIELPEGTVGMLKSKSGLNVRYGIVSEGVIDVGYTGSIVAKLYNHSGRDYKVNACDKITQLVIMPIITPELEVVDELEATDRGDNGFGSSGR